MSKKSYFIGVDSDGTAFNSMIPKHKDAFIPATIKVWNLQQYTDTVFEIEERINLYSKQRGVNRFPGQLMLFEELKEKGIDVGDFSAFKKYVEKSSNYSNTSLKEYMKENPDPFLDKVMEWSTLGDKLFFEAANGMPPFNGVKEALAEVSKFADVVVVSSASAKGLIEDWTAGGIVEYTYKIMGQENGTKKQQLKTAVDGKYSEGCVLMIGDAIGDYEAAKSVNALFYPILPGKEEESWKNFLETGTKKFLEGTFEGEYQESLLNEFLKILS